MTSSPPYRIIIVDDERVAMQAYYRELRVSGYDVCQYRSVDELKAFLGPDPIPEAHFFIVDVMLEAGELYSAEPTADGLYTGLFLAQDLRRRYPLQPIILFSNYTLPRIKAAADRLALRLPHCLALAKVETRPSELADIVSRYFRDFSLRPNRRSNILERLFRSLLLQPNIGGIGVDLKKWGEPD